MVEKRLGCKWSGFWSNVIWNPEAQPFEIRTKKSVFLMVQFLNGLKTGQFEIQTFKKSGFQIPAALKLEYPPLWYSKFQPFENEKNIEICVAFQSVCLQGKVKAYPA